MKHLCKIPQLAPKWQKDCSFSKYSWKFIQLNEKFFGKFELYQFCYLSGGKEIQKIRFCYIFGS